MKIKMVVTIMIMAFIVGCNQQQTKQTTTPEVTTEPSTTPEPPQPVPPSTPDGYLDEEASRQWLEKHGYQLVKITDGHRIKKESPGVSIDNKLLGSGTSLIGLLEGVTVMHQNGKIYISK